MMASRAQQLQQARKELAPVAGELAPLEARLLAQHAWGVDAETLVRDAGRPAASVDSAALEALIKRRLTHEPIAQIVGYRHFWKDKFLVTSDVLTPRADSETLVELCLKLRPNGVARILDLGTGSGCLLLSLLREYPQATGVGIDHSPAALSVAERNARELGLSDRAQFLCSDWCKELDKSLEFDMVVTNPPYIPSGEIAALAADVRDHEPRNALDGGKDGLDGYRAILAQLAPHLAGGAIVFAEIGIAQAALVSSIAGEHGYDVTNVARDLAGTERVVALEANPSMKRIREGL